MLQDWSHQYRSLYGHHHELMGRYGVSICAVKTWFVQRFMVFLASFIYPGLLMNNSAGVSRKVEEDYPTCAPGPCFQFLVESELLICFCYFVCMILVTLCSLLCMSVLHVWSLSLDYILLIGRYNLGSLDYSLTRWAIQIPWSLLFRLFLPSFCCCFFIN